MLDILDSMTTCVSYEEKELACELRQTFDLISPFIERHTSIICPQCEDVCCIDRHGRYDEDDIRFLNALGIEVVMNNNAGGETDPCRYLTEKGCSLPRWKRPFRCTHFFCDPLLKSLETDDPKLYRAFVDYLQHLIYLRQRLLNMVLSGESLHD
jgi:hypothetical protein